ncbi:MAG: phosphatidylserine decarboxylase family protein [Desulfovibrionaceae bacterium]
MKWKLFSAFFFLMVIVCPVQSIAYADSLRSPSAGRQCYKISADAKISLTPVIQEFKDVIENDPHLYMLFTEMFEQIPNEPPYLKDPAGNVQVRSYQQMLNVLNCLLTSAPEFNDTIMAGTPINAMLAWPMGTPAGTEAFLDKRVNQQLKKILKQWEVYLASPDSRYVLTDKPGGWFSPQAMKVMPDFDKNFVCDPNKPFHGFASWDDFFTRLFRKGQRPVESPDNDAIIVNACESAPYRLAKNVKLRDKFWIKGEPYSLYHMLDGDSLTEQFVGGTFYQAFLSAFNYHRWHSPVSGTIVKTKLVDGSYYAAALVDGFDPETQDNCQGYITHTAARGIVFIKADNPDIGLMGILFVGMGDVSSNEITVYEGQHVEKGDQLGMFHFGGSTHVLMFRPGVNVEFDLRGQTPSVNAKNIPLLSKLAVVKGKK